MIVDTAAMRIEANSDDTGLAVTLLLRSAADEIDELRETTRAAIAEEQTVSDLLYVERAAHELTKEQLAELHQQMTLAEVARDASREAYDAERAAHEATKPGVGRGL